jgi:uncharacterized membrane protein YqaE (UPF0057 family)
MYILAIFLPPVPVFLKAGLGADFVINICLTILAWIPGVIRKWLLFPHSNVIGGRIEECFIEREKTDA